jgi:5-methylcytosine-specific restriction enzyme subunit McrC
MSIPIKNIYFLLCYAWNALDKRDLVDVDQEDFKNLSDLFAKVLMIGTTHLFKRGLDQGYKLFEEQVRTIRGKLLVEASTRKLLLHQAKAMCAYDELTHNVLHNQILKTTIRRLLLTDALDAHIRIELELLYRRFPNVEEINLHARHFNLFQPTRNNKYYGFLLDVCRIIHEHWLTNEGAGLLTFQDFIRDEHRMRKLFERFVFNFYDHEALQFEVFSQDIRWQTSKPGPDDVYLPKMQTDVCLLDRAKKRKIVVETKFKQEVFQKYWDTEKVHSENMYQFYAYLKNVEANGGVDTTCEGILLYAATDRHPDLRFSFPNHNIRVTALNLDQDWRNIERDLLSLVQAPAHLSFFIGGSRA